MTKPGAFAFIAILFLTFPKSIKAEVKLPTIISSNMVLQRNTTIQLWGWSDPEEKITVNASWLKEISNIKADINGNWRIELKTNNSKLPQNIKIKSKISDILLENILFGEVWLCSGQSNIQQSMKGYIGQPTFNTNMAIAQSKNLNLRLFTVEHHGSKIPLDDIKKYNSWQHASPMNVSNFSAVAYFYGQQLQEILDCPVGIIHSSWGGSSVQAWMSKESLSNYQKINLDKADLQKNGTQKVPTALYNGMIHPLIPFTLKGALWYQGESNRKGPQKYEKLFPAMVKDWRKRWGIGNFPFYYVQIAPFIYSGNDSFSTPDNSAFMREAQIKCLDLIPNSGIAITLDVGGKYSIHPPKKKEVADRLLFIALNNTYGYKTIAYETPIYDSLENKEDGIIINFKNVQQGLFTYDKLKNFEIAGKDKVFYPADAKIVNRKQVFVKSSSVTKQVAVRYAWCNWVSGTLFSGNLLPASSFRTDNWDDATQIKIKTE